jgi:hypothetical protein
MESDLERMGIELNKKRMADFVILQKSKNRLNARSAMNQVRNEYQYKNKNQLEKKK